MFRKLFYISHRCRPVLLRMGIMGVAGLGIVMMSNKINYFNSIHCYNFSSSGKKNVIGQIIPKIIRIQRNGVMKGWAYCYEDGVLVTVCEELQQQQQLDINSYQLYIDDRKIKTKLKVLTRFENLTLISVDDHSISPMIAAKNSDLYSHVSIIHPTYFPTINDAYYVGNDCGFAIINGSGQVGNLVTGKDGVIGVVSQIGRDNDQGFMRMIMWKDIRNVMQKAEQWKRNGMYLGISVAGLPQRDGLSILRIAPNSIFSAYFKMGDIITKVNNHTIRNPEDLTRVITISERNVVFEVEDPNRNRRLVSVEI